MELRNLFLLAGGIALFMYGMYQMGEGLARLAGGRMKEVLGRMAGSPVKAVLMGAGVTAVIQSSSATTVMVVQLVDAGLLGIEQAAGIIMGANIGTCVTAWMLGTADSAVNISIFALFGAAMLFLWELKWYHKEENSREFRRARYVACILFGVAMLFLGMKAMQEGTATLAEMPEFQRMLLQFENPLQGVLAGALFTAVIQSSSASIGILQALSASGAVSYHVAIPVILGQNIGTCATAFLACIGVGRNGRMAAMLHLVFNVVGTGLFLFGFYSLHRIFGFAFMEKKASAVGIALVHTLFNLFVTLVLLPLLCGWSRAVDITPMHNGHPQGMAESL